MLSKVRGKNYLILHPGDKYYTKINKNKMDRSLGRIIRALEVIDQEMRDNSDVRDLIWDEVFYNTQFDSGYGEYPNGIGMVLEYAEGLKQQLETGDDDIPEPEDVLLLSDIGYKHQPFDKEGYWMKPIEDTRVQAIIEELWIAGDPIRRRRTIDYEIINGGRSSTNVVYKKLPIGKKLMKIIQNTKNDERKEEEQG